MPVDPLPTLGVSSLDLGRSHANGLFLRAKCCCRTAQALRRAWCNPQSQCERRAIAPQHQTHATEFAIFLSIRGRRTLQPVVSVLAALQFLHLQFVRRTFTYCSAGSLSLARDHAALLGRFLPRLGPFGNPGWPFFLSDRLKSLGKITVRRRARADHETVITSAPQHRVFYMCAPGLGRCTPERAFPP